MKECVICVHIIPNAKQFRIIGFDAWKKAFKIKTKNPAVNGKANNELLLELSHLLHADIELISGQKAREKTLKISKKIRPKF